MIEKSKIKNQKSKLQNGFTLIELLVVMSILVIVGVIIAAILINTLRGSSKATILTDVKQNGNYALSQMVQNLRNATSINLTPCGNPSTAVQSITSTQVNNIQTTFDCSGSTITSNGTSLLDTTKVQLVPSSCSIVCSQQSATDYPVIQIQFSLAQKSTSTFVEQTASLSFQTSVVLRNTQN